MEPQHDSHVFVLSMRCVECDRRWEDGRDRWRVYLTADQPPEPLTYCHDCARREFDD